MELNIMENGKMIKKKDKALYKRKMGKTIMGNGNQIKSMEMENKYIKMVLSTKVNGLVI